MDGVTANVTRKGKLEEMGRQLELNEQIIKCYRRGTGYDDAVSGIQERCKKRQEGVFEDSEGECLVVDGQYFGKLDQVGDGRNKKVYRAVVYSQERRGVRAWVETREKADMRWVQQGYQRLLELPKHKNIQRPSRFYFEGGKESPIRIIAIEDLFDTTLEEIELPKKRVIPMARQMAEAVAFLHRQLLRHGDIKPGNFLVRADGTVRLTDFDCSEKLADAEHRAEREWGTMTHGAPEFFFEKEVGLKADVWALALVVYRMLYRAVKDPADADAMPPFVAKALEHLDMERVWKDEAQTSEVKGKIGKALCPKEIKLDWLDPLPQKLIKWGLAASQETEHCDEPRCTAEEFLGEIQKMDGLERVEGNGS